MKRIAVGIRECLSDFGALVPDADLLAMVLTGPNAHDVAEEVLSSVGQVESLKSRRLGELTSIKGMTENRAYRLLAAMELGRRISLPPKGRKVLQTAADVASHCIKLATDPDETFYALSLNSRNQVRGEWVVARGWESGVNLTVRQVMTLLSKESATRTVFVHNHPSGDPMPSPEDIRFTDGLLSAGRVLGIKILDHVVVAADGHISIRDYAGNSLAFDR